jgi:hypothetical protein
MYNNTKNNKMSIPLWLKSIKDEKDFWGFINHTNGNNGKG